MCVCVSSVGERVVGLQRHLLALLAIIFVHGRRSRYPRKLQEYMYVRVCVCTVMYLSMHKYVLKQLNSNAKTQVYWRKPSK